VPLGVPCLGHVQRPMVFLRFGLGFGGWFFDVWFSGCPIPHVSRPCVTEESCFCRLRLRDRGVHLLALPWALGPGGVGDLERRSHLLANRGRSDLSRQRPLSLNVEAARKASPPRRLP